MFETEPSLCYLRSEIPREVDVTKEVELVGRTFPCPVCGKGCDIREDKNGKPYVICDRCSAQLFVRGEPGIEALRRRLGRVEAPEPAGTGRSQSAADSLFGGD